MDGYYQFNKRLNPTYGIFFYVLYTSDNTWFCNFIYGYVGLFDIYNKEDWRVIMAEEKDIKIKKVLQDMSYSLNHIEDTMADDRALLAKLVKQNNSIVEWLKQVEIDAEYDDTFQTPLSKEEEKKMQKFENLKEVLDEVIDKRKDLVEFEEELKKHKDKLTPGQIGEA
tara:strand:+ start:35 stop:538 length:504 start_codon:yes stop_codon:yes gene_type:complete